jgi:hypothetical protein
MITRYRGREVSEADVAFIRQLIANHPEANRRQLSLLLCEAWRWTQPNGVLRDMVARGLLLTLARAGQIELPKSLKPYWRITRRTIAPAPLLVWPKIEMALSELRPLEFRQVRRGPDEELFATLVQTHHYLGYTRPVGEHLKYIVYARGAPVACAAWSSAPRHIGCRDRFIGWNQAVRREHIHLIAYNTRYLILPWVRVPHLASHLLSRMARIVPSDWQALYQHPIHLLETFVDPERHKGTCYRAANWMCVGLTTGRGKNDQTMRANRSLKEIWVYPIHRRFRELLGVTHQVNQVEQPSVPSA